MWTDEPDVQRPIYTVRFCNLLTWPFTLAIFDAILVAIFDAISNHPCKLSPRNRLEFTRSIWNRRKIALEIAAEIAAKIASVNGPYDTLTTLLGHDCRFKILQLFSCRKRVAKEVACDNIVPYKSAFQILQLCSCRKGGCMRASKPSLEDATRAPPCAKITVLFSSVL